MEVDVVDDRLPVRFGLIGPGKFADRWRIPALAKNTGGILWSVLGQDSQRALCFAQKHKAIAPQPVHTDLQEFLQDPDLDAVIVASPDRLHAAHAIAAAEAGKHVLVEKPMTASYDDAFDVLNACDDAGVQLAAGYHLRWHAGHRLLAEKIRAGVLGELQHVRVQWTYVADAAERNTTRELTRWWSLSALGTHAIDLVMWLMEPHCGPLVEIKLGQEHNAQRDETAVVVMRFQSLAVAVINVSVKDTMPRTVEIQGSRAHAVCVDTLGPRGAGEIRIDGVTMPFEVVDPYAAELASFVHTIRTGSEHLTDGSVGFKNVGLLEKLSQEIPYKELRKC